MTTIESEAQELKKHQWKNRIILILCSDTNSDLLKSQLKEFDFKSEDFLDRNLIGYLIFPEKYRLLNSDEIDWKENSVLYQKFAGKERNFKVLLIGLDVTIKLEQDKVLSKEQLFATIDAMPMRRTETRNRN